MPLPPVATSVSLYAVPSVPLGREIVVTARLALMVTVRLAVAVFPPESVTMTVKVAVPAMGAVPERTPPLERLRPTAERLLAPALTLQV